MAEKKKYNSILISGRKDQTLTYSKYVKDEESGESVKESLDKKVNVTDELTTQQIKDGAITNEKLAADSVGNINLQEGSVSNEKLEDGSITNEKLAENSITKDKLQDKTIGIEKLDNELRQTIAAATGLPEDLVETIQNVDDTLKDHQSQLDDKQSQIDDKQSQIDDKQQQITANDEDISLLQTRSTQMEETIKSIAATGGASQATAVTYNNEKSGLIAVNAQAAIDEVDSKLSDLSKTLRVFDKVYLSANSSIKAYDVLPIGSTYEFTNKGQFPVSISLRKGEDDVVQEIKYGLSVGDTVTAKINETYEFIFIYSSKTPNVHIKQKDTIVKAVAELENTTSTLQSKTADLYEKDNLKKSILHSQIMANRNSSLIEWEPGHIDQEGNDSDYDKDHRYRSNFLYLKAGDTIRCADSKVYFYLFKYNKDFSFESVSESALKEIVIEDNCIARILAVCYDVSSTFLSKVSASTKGVALSVSTQNVDSHLAKNVFDKFDFGWEHGHIDVNGLNSFYDAKYRMRSKFLYVKKGDILALIRNSKERYIIYYYSEKKLLVKATDWLISNTKIEENGFIRILLAYTNNADFSTDEKLSDSMQYYTFGEFDNWKNASWEMGGIAKADGRNYDSSSSCRNSRILHLKAGTIVIPYVFGRYLIAYYDNDGNFLRREPVADNGGQHNDGYYSQNAFEFKEDVNVRFVLFWMNAAKFDKNEGYENILSNDDTAESLSRKFRIIPPSYKMPYYIKKVIDDKNKEIAALGNIFKATFITDPHEYYYHEIAARYCAELTSNVLLNGGDLLSYPQNGVDSAIDTVSRHMQALVGCSVPVIMTRGNHEASMDTILTDGNDPHYENAYNRQIYYAQVQRPLMNSAFKYNIGYEDSGYFFYDDKINKVRIICLNNFVAGSYHRIEQHQRYWLIEQALDLSSKGEDEKNWAVIAVGHSPILDKIDYDEPYATNEDRWISDVFKACYNKTNVIISDPDTELGEDYVTYRNEHKWNKYNEWTSLVHDFTGIKYQFACYLCGHSHYDKISKDKDFPHINTTCAHPLENIDKYRRVFDTELEYAFDVLCLDKANRKIILKRIGVGTDRNTSY